ncbi:MAG: acyl-CoA thioesterase [Acidobacteria bacterium]|nr:MAG: acyl-CoA thioesterase [Acidobacteriota bacterium]
MGRNTFTRQELLDAADGPERFEMAVRFQDVDAAGVIFFARALEYCSDALFELIERAGFPGRRMFVEREFVTPVKHAEAHYVRPLRYGDRVAITIPLARVRESDFTLGYRLTRASDGEPAVVGAIHQVCVDPGTFSRIPIPGEFRTVLDRIAGHVS